MTTTKAKATSWRDVLPVHPAADLFPLMPPDELRALGENIKKNGLRSPVVLFLPTDADNKRESWSLLDGRNRLDAMEAVGLNVTVHGKRDPSIMIDVSGDARSLLRSTKTNPIDPYEFVLSANVHRRHLTEAQRIELCEKVMRADPRKSSRRVAKLTGVSPTTAAKTRKELEAKGDVSIMDTSIDTKGRQQPTTKKRLTLDDWEADRRARQAEQEPQQVDIEDLAPTGQRQAKPQTVKAERRAIRESELAARITALPTRKYGVIYADPPWRFEPWSRDTGMDRAADNHYPTMPTESIIAGVDVSALAADDAVLFLWATAPMLSDALAVMAAWDFAYKTHIIWDKGRVGTGYWARARHELLLIGTRGNVPAPTPGTQPESIVAAPAREHSRKPDCLAEMIERLFPTMPKIELFARGPARLGWDAWGNEAEPDSKASPVVDPLAIPEILRRTGPARPPLTA